MDLSIIEDEKPIVLTKRGREHLKKQEEDLENQSEKIQKCDCMALYKDMREKQEEAKNAT